MKKSIFFCVLILCLGPLSSNDILAEKLESISGLNNHPGPGWRTTDCGAKDVAVCNRINMLIDEGVKDRNYLNKLADCINEERDVINKQQEEIVELSEKFTANKDDVDAIKERLDNITKEMNAIKERLDSVIKILMEQETIEIYPLIK